MASPSAGNYSLINHGRKTDATPGAGNCRIIHGRKMASPSAGNFWLINHGRHTEASLGQHCPFFSFEVPKSPAWCISNFFCRYIFFVAYKSLYLFYYQFYLVDTLLRGHTSSFVYSSIDSDTMIQPIFHSFIVMRSDHFLPAFMCS